MRYKQFAVSKLSSFRFHADWTELVPESFPCDHTGITARDQSPVSDQASARAFAGADLASGEVGHALISAWSLTAK